MCFQSAVVGTPSAWACLWARMVPLGANAKIHFLGPGLRRQLHKLSWGWVWSIDQDAIPDWWFEDPLIFEILLSHCFPSWHNCGPATDFSAQWACFSLKPWIALQNQCQWFATYSQPQGSLADLLRPWTQWLNHWTLKRSNPSSKWMLEPGCSNWGQLSPHLILPAELPRVLVMSFSPTLKLSSLSQVPLSEMLFSLAHPPGTTNSPLPTEPMTSWDSSA